LEFHKIIISLHKQKTKIMIKKTTLFLAVAFAFAALQSCSKCGQCVADYKNGTQTNTVTGSVYCGNNNNESGSYYKEAKLDCEQIPTRYQETNPNSTTVVTSTWVDVK
jgi:hypothetical protein